MGRSLPHAPTSRFFLAPFINSYKSAFRFLPLPRPERSGAWTTGYMRIPAVRRSTRLRSRSRLPDWRCRSQPIPGLRRLASCWSGGHRPKLRAQDLHFVGDLPYSAGEFAEIPGTLREGSNVVCAAPRCCVCRVRRRRDRSPLCSLPPVGAKLEYDRQGSLRLGAKARVRARMTLNDVTVTRGSTVPPKVK